MKKTIAAILALLMLAGLLCGCGAGVQPAAGGEPETSPEPTPEPTPDPAADLPEGAILVSTVDEFLAALGSDRTIVLQEGDYDLSLASDYGREGLRGAYHWELLYGGCGLVIEGVDGLKIQGLGQVQILARPRYAEVLSFIDCWDLSLESLTLGHTEAPGPCGAGVLALTNCQDARLSGCRLFGCGTMGIRASACSGLFAEDCQIDSCSDGAVQAFECKDMRLTGCVVRDCGKGENGGWGELFSVQRCKGFALVNCQIQASRCSVMLHNYWSEQVSMLGCQVSGIRCGSAMFQLDGRSLVIDKCSFERRSGESYYTDTKRFAVSPDGTELMSFDLDRMEHGEASYDGPVETPRPTPVVAPDGSAQVEVDNVDDFLAAIAPGVTVVLAAGDYDLTAAAGYGTLDGDFYQWLDCYDGFQLEIHDCDGLTIRGAGKDQTRILAEPRYATVIGFNNCSDLRLESFTAGHTPAPAYCTGNVIDLIFCQNVTVEGCGFFGCGVVGINGQQSQDITVRDTEIYECSWQAASFDYCEGVRFEGCLIHDCDDGNDAVKVFCSSVFWEEQALDDGTHFFDGSHYIGKAMG
ncbi:MAG: right-handed parallel beta-helix repeat-containing protein [Oscillospiraceae bacterium]|nr:right-handed parallel beta-helix repeat-containing protein [Oscillospiraceae bacterium]